MPRQYRYFRHPITWLLSLPFGFVVATAVMSEEAKVEIRQKAEQSKELSFFLGALKTLLGTGLGVAIAQQVTDRRSQRRYGDRVSRTLGHIIDNQLRGLWNLYLKFYELYQVNYFSQFLQPMAAFLYSPPRSEFG